MPDATHLDALVDADRLSPSEGVDHWGGRGHIPSLEHRLKSAVEQVVGAAENKDNGSKRRHRLSRVRRILEGRLALDGRPKETLEELGNEMGVSRERIRQIERVCYDRIIVLVNRDSEEP